MQNAKCKVQNEEAPKSLLWIEKVAYENLFEYDGCVDCKAQNSYYGIILRSDVDTSVSFRRLKDPPSLSREGFVTSCPRCQSPARVSS